MRIHTKTERNNKLEDGKEGFCAKIHDLEGEKEGGREREGGREGGRKGGRGGSKIGGNWEEKGGERNLKKTWALMTRLGQYLIYSERRINCKFHSD